MINIILFLFFIACVSLTVAMIVDNPGTVSMIWFDYQIDTSVAFIILAVLLLAIVTIIFTLIIRNIFSVPANFLQKRKISNLKSGISELTYSVAALASSNIEAAEKHVHKVERLIGRTPLTLLLSAQIAKNRGEETKTQALLEQLLEYKETEYLAARSLSDSASKQDNLPKALHLAKQAQIMDPSSHNCALTVISLHVRLKQWNEALASVTASKLPRKEKKRLKAFIQLSYGQQLLDNGHEEEALGAAASLIRALPDFAPAVAFAARAYHKNGMTAKSMRLLSRAWKKNPSPLIIDVLDEVTKSFSEQQRSKLHSRFSGELVNGIWTCKSCDNSQLFWNLNCDSCGSFSTLEWK